MGDTAVIIMTAFNKAIPKVVASVEARMSSSRLPGKMLMDIAGKPMVLHVLDRLAHASLLDDIVLATTINPADDELASVADKAGYKVFRGSEDDVLKRVVDAHTLMQSEIIVEICGDCPLIDPSLVDLAISTYTNNSCDVVSSGLEQSYPQGTEVQVFSYKALEHVSLTIDDAAVREHVSLYFYEHPEIYKVVPLVAPDELRSPDTRLQIDYEEDLMMVRELHHVISTERLFGIREVLSCLQQYPEIVEINRNCEERSVRG